MVYCGVFQYLEIPAQTVVHNTTSNVTETMTTAVSYHDLDEHQRHGWAPPTPIDDQHRGCGWGPGRGGDHMQIRLKHQVLVLFVVHSLSPKAAVTLGVRPRGGLSERG